VIGFEIHIEGDGRVVVSGELDMATSPQVTSAVESVAGSGCQRVVLDLNGVTFIDSSGISALALAKARLDVDGAVLVLAKPSRQVEAVLQMAGLESEFVREP
jgi:anti-sigma B factor antagonist